MEDKFVTEYEIADSRNVREWYGSKGYNEPNRRDKAMSSMGAAIGGGQGYYMLSGNGANMPPVSIPAQPKTATQARKEQDELIYLRRHNTNLTRVVSKHSEELQLAHYDIASLKEQLDQLAAEMHRRDGIILALEAKLAARQDGNALNSMTHSEPKAGQLSRAIDNLNISSTKMGLPLHDRY